METAPSTEDLERVGTGYQADVFAWGPGRVLRLAHRPDQRQDVANETAALTAAGRAGAPVPTAFGRVEVDGRPGVVMQRVEGEDLLFLLGRRPWLLPDIAGAL